MMPCPSPATGSSPSRKPTKRPTDSLGLGTDTDSPSSTSRASDLDRAQLTHDLSDKERRWRHISDLIRAGLLVLALGGTAAAAALLSHAPAPAPIADSR